MLSTRPAPLLPWHTSASAAYPALPEAVAQARAHTLDLLMDWDLVGSLCCDAELVVSELVTNAVRHANTTAITVTVHRRASRLRIEVADDDPARVPRWDKSSGYDAEYGRGLLLVDAVSVAHGHHAEPTTKSVWVDLAL